jgi:hypothetical protein
MSRAAWEYRDGGKGFGKWVEDFIYLPIYPPGSVIPIWTSVKDLPRTPDPVTGRSYWSMWEEQKRVAEEALAMNDDGTFIFRLLVFCWMRGEGKSLFVCLIQLWKFFNWPKQLIVLGANSKDQVKFVHYDIMVQMITNSPLLLAKIGPKNIQEKEIRIMDKHGNPASTIRSISSFSGIVSNITGYTFSEIFDLKNHKFFYQLDGSIRNIPNALGTIDSTVSEKNHPLHKLYKSWKENKDPTLYFSHRQSEQGRMEDFWNPLMTAVQLDSYREKFPDAEFAQYFKNTWEAGARKVFTKNMVKETRYIGARSQLGMHAEIQATLQKLDKIDEQLDNADYKPDAVESQKDVLSRTLIPVEGIYKLRTPNGHPRICELDELAELGNKLQTDWFISAGIDRADPMKKQYNARTIISVIAKGLPNSRGNFDMIYDENVKKYIYFLLGLFHVESSSLADIKAALSECVSMYDGVDVLGAERWGMWDIADWCEEHNIIFDPIYPTYDKQRDAFSELFTIYSSGMFKCPPLGVPGSKDDDILEEEALNFDHNPYKRWYGSPEKREKNGIQDDAMFATAWGIYSARNYGVEHFRERTPVISFGHFEADRSLTGNY